MLVACGHGHHCKAPGSGAVGAFAQGGEGQVAESSAFAAIHPAKSIWLNITIFM